MVEIGYKLNTEEHGAPALVRNAGLAEEAGFDFVSLTDHYHPWNRTEGQSPFAWTVLGGIAAVTDRVKVSTGVTCPTVRYHPAIVAQMAATAASLMEGRFELGIGSGENLNEHILGDRWPPATVRIEMMKEAIDVIRTPRRARSRTTTGPTTWSRRPASSPCPRRCRRSSSRGWARSRRRWRRSRGTS